MEQKDLDDFKKLLTQWLDAKIKEIFSK